MQPKKKKRTKKASGKTPLSRTRAPDPVYAELKLQLGALQARLTQMEKDREETAGLASDRRARVDRLIQSYEEQARLAEKLISRVETLQDRIDRMEKPREEQEKLQSAGDLVHDDPSSESFRTPYDGNLLERSRTQWQFGDWDSLIQLDRGTLQHHPDRGKLALLAAAGHLQADNPDRAREFIRLAREWGCGKQLVSRILIAGVHNSLGRAAAANGQQDRSLKHFQTSVAAITPGADVDLISQTRIIRESTRLGLLPQAAEFAGERLAAMKSNHLIDRSRVKMIETELELINHELSIALQRQQLYQQSTRDPDHVIIEGSAEWLSNIKKKSVSQLGQDIWVLEKTNFKRGGFFVEFGATNGILLSNTWLLEKEFNWRGICAEPNPLFFKQLKGNRHCIVSDQYIGGETGKRVEFILADAYGGSAEYAQYDMHKDKRDAYAMAGNIISVKSISLNDFLEQHNAPHEIDYISIDTEGSEYDIINNFPFIKWNINLLTIEHNFTERRVNIRNLLESYGYKCTEREFDDWFEKDKK